MDSLLDKLKQRITWKSVMISSVMMVALILIRYFVVLVSVFGITSQFTYNGATASYVIRRAVERDAHRVGVRVNRLIRPRVPMENVWTRVMEESVSADDLAPSTDRDTLPGDDFVIIPGLAASPPQAAASGGDAPSGVHRAGDDVRSASDWTTPSGDVWARKHSRLELINRQNVPNLKLLHEFDTGAAFGTRWVSNTEAPALSTAVLIKFLPKLLWPHYL